MERQQAIEQLWEMNEWVFPGVPNFRPFLYEVQKMVDEIETQIDKTEFTFNVYGAWKARHTLYGYAKVKVSLDEGGGIEIKLEDSEPEWRDWY